MTRARLFRNGQTVRLPRELALPGREVFVRRVGTALLLVPTEDPWAGVEAALDRFGADFLSDRDPPVADARESL